MASAAAAVLAGQGRGRRLGFDDDTGRDEVSIFIDTHVDDLKLARSDVAFARAVLLPFDFGADQLGRRATDGYLG
ncbi:MAG: hypothetical protein IH590_12185, partial [Aquamicrobium sp.]|nr:hypothetical protein [Aquamicrobium sp.]